MKNWCLIFYQREYCKVKEREFYWVRFVRHPHTDKQQIKGKTPDSLLQWGNLLAIAVGDILVVEWSFFLNQWWSTPNDASCCRDVNAPIHRERMALISMTDVTQTPWPLVARFKSQLNFWRHQNEGISFVLLNHCVEFYRLGQTMPSHTAGTTPYQDTCFSFNSSPNDPTQTNSRTQQKFV